MSSITSKQNRARTERERGWIIFLLYHARPRSLEFAQLRRLLDQHNIPLSSRRLAEYISYLCELRLIKVELEDGRAPADDREQERAIQRYAESDIEGFNEHLSLRLSAAGVNFQEGVGIAPDGISRVE